MTRQVDVTPMHAPKGHIKRTGHKGEVEGVVHVSQAAHVPQHVGQLTRLEASARRQGGIGQRIHGILAWWRAGGRVAAQGPRLVVAC